MWTLTLTGMRARKLRLVLSAFSVVLGIAFVTASFTLGDTINRSFTQHIDDVHAGIDAVVTAEGDSGFTQAGVPADVLTTVRRTDGVAAAEGTTTGFAQLRSLETGETPTESSGLALGWIEDPDLNPLSVAAGRAPEHPDEVVVDRATAESIGVDLGDRARLVTHGPARDVTVVGFAEVGEGGLPVLGIEAGTAADVFGFPGEFTEIEVRAAEGLAEEALRDRLQAALAGAGAGDVIVRTGSEVSEETAESISSQTEVITTFLLVFAGITLFVGGFLIVNTFGMLTAQRTRELAVLRALGASRGQLLRGVVLEAVVVGLVSALVGIGAGLLVARGLQALLDRLGLGIPETSLTLEPRTVLVALVLGPVVTAVAALLPARRAAAVEPVEAMRESALPTLRRRRRVVLGSALTVLALGALVAGQQQGSTPLVGLGAVGLLVAVIAWGPLALAPVTRVLAWPLVRLGGRATRLAEGNVQRTPHRSASTAAALVVGLALVSGTSVIGASMSGLVDAEIEGTLEADVVLTASQGMLFGPETAASVEDLPGVAAAAPVTFAQAEVRSSGRVEEHTVNAMDPRTLGKVLSLEMVEGSAADLGEGSVLVAEDAGLSVGDELTVTVPGSPALPLTVGAVHAGTATVADYLLSTADLASVAPRSADGAVLVTARPGVAAGALARSLDEHLLDAFPLVHADTRAEFAASRKGTVDEAVAMITVLLGLSLLVALLGVANTLTLSVIERTREVGMLRSIGMSRRQLRSMVRVEALLMAAYGALVGAGLGLVLGRAVSSVLLGGLELPVVVPAERLALFAVVAVASAVAAATLPARRAARLDVLAAVNTV